MRFNKTSLFKFILFLVLIPMFYYVSQSRVGFPMFELKNDVVTCDNQKNCFEYLIKNNFKDDNALEHIFLTLKRLEGNSKNKILKGADYIIYSRKGAISQVAHVSIKFIKTKGDNIKILAKGIGGFFIKAYLDKLIANIRFNYEQKTY